MVDANGAAAIRILIVDDEPDVVAFLSMVLEDEGYATVSAADGESGLAIAKEQAPDLITLDVTMPGMSGTEVFRRLRTDPATRTIPVVVVTGVAGYNEFISQRSVEPPEGFHEKPIDPAALAELVRGILDKRQHEAV